MMSRVRSGSALYAGVIAIAGLSVFWAGMSFRAGRRSMLRVNEPTPLSLATAMTQCGFGPSELAAAGVEPNSVGSIVTAARMAIIENNLDFAAVGQSLASARQAAEKLEAAVRSGDGSIETLASLAAARTTLSNADAQLSSARATVRAAVATVVSEEVSNKLATIQSSSKDLPLKFRLVNRSEASRTALRSALANQRIASACGDTPHQGCSQMIATAGSDAAVADADVSLATHGAAATAAWKQAVGLH